MARIASEKAIWMFPAAVVLHNIEEAIWMPGFWAKHNLHVPYTPLGFRILTIIVDLAAFASAYWCVRSGKKSAGV